MKPMIPNTHTIFGSAAKAEAVIAKMDLSDSDWTYAVKVFDNGRAVITIQDEDNEFVGYL
jgi:hypothetical protein